MTDEIKITQNYLHPGNNFSLVLTNTIDNYYTKNETYNKKEVDAKISGIEGTIPSTTPITDLSNYYNKTETIEQIDNKISAIPPPPTTDLSNYYTKEDINKGLKLTSNEKDTVNIHSAEIKLKNMNDDFESYVSITKEGIEIYSNDEDIGNGYICLYPNRIEIKGMECYGFEDRIPETFDDEDTIPTCKAVKNYVDSKTSSGSLTNYYSKDDFNNTITMNGSIKILGKSLLYSLNKKIELTLDASGIIVQDVGNKNPVCGIYDGVFVLKGNMITDISQTIDANEFTLPTSNAVYDYVASQIDTKIARLATAGKVDLSNYYTKNETDKNIDNKIDKKISAIPPPPTTDLSNYYNKTETDARINRSMSDIIVSISAIPPPTVSLPNVNIKGDISPVSFEIPNCFKVGIDIGSNQNEIFKTATYDEDRALTLIWGFDDNYSTIPEINGLIINIYSIHYDTIITSCNYDGTSWNSGSITHNKPFIYLNINELENRPHINILNDLIPKPEIITNTNIPDALNLISNMVNENQFNLKINYYNKKELYTKNEIYNKKDIDTKIDKIYNYLYKYKPGGLAPIEPIRNTTITHNAPLEEPLINYEIGKPVFMSGKIFKLESNKYVNDYTSTDCIPSVKTTGTYKEFLGIIVGIHDIGYNNLLEPTITFATHGDYVYWVEDSSIYSIGDVLLYTGQILSDSIIMSSKICSMRIGVVSAILSKNMLSIFKS